MTLYAFVSLCVPVFASGVNVCVLEVVVAKCFVVVAGTLAWLIPLL